MNYTHYQKKTKIVSHKHPRLYKQTTTIDLGDKLVTTDISAPSIDYDVHKEKNPDKIQILKLKGSVSDTEIAWYKETKDPFLFPSVVALKDHDIEDLFCFCLAYIRLKKKDTVPKRIRIRKEWTPKIEQFMGKISKTKERRSNPRPQ